MVIFIVQKNIINLWRRNPSDERKFMKADYPLRFNNSVVNKFQKGKECGDIPFYIRWNTLLWTEWN